MKQEANRALPTEQQVCRAWHRAAFRHGGLQAATGQPIAVVFPGNWTHNFGPDFHDALIAFGPDLRRGDVEVHLRASSWHGHGHDSDPAYNEVILHAVVVDDGAPCVTARGFTVPTTVLPIGPIGAEPAPGDEQRPLATMPCAARAPMERFPDVLSILERAGDARLAVKVARFESALTADAPAQVLFAGLLEGLGYSRNVKSMRRLAALAPLDRIESSRLAPAGAWEEYAAILLGAAGLLATPTLARRARVTAGEVETLRQHWRRCSDLYGLETLAGAEWSWARTRPANYPERRLLGLSTLLARCQPGGILAATRDVLLGGEATRGARRLRDFIRGDRRPERWPLGQDRADDLAVNVVLPFAMAYGDWNQDDRLVEAAARLWERYPTTGSNAAVDRFILQVGGSALRLRSARQQQGALAVYRQLCERRRCFECPLARLAREEA